MKIILVFNLLLLSFIATAQKASFSNNTATYLGKTYRVGDIIQLGYGSGNNKDFAFVSFGKAIGNVNLPGLIKKADVNWSKAEVEIVRIYITNGVIWAKCNPLNRDANLLNKQIFINIEGAVDNNEIKSVRAGNQTATVPQNNAPVPSPAMVKGGNQPKTEKQNITEEIPPPPVKKTPEKKQVSQNIPQSGRSTATGKLYFRTLMWTGMYGTSLDISWIFLGNDGTIVNDPENGVNPVNYSAELQNNARNVGKYTIAGNKLHITWNNGKTETWSLEYQKGEISAMNGGIVTRPKPVPANYKLSGQYAASAVLPNVSSVHTLIFSNDGSFTLGKSGAVSTRDVSALSQSASKGTYKISGNTLWLHFDNGETQIGTLYIWEQGGGKRHLVINKSSYPQER